MGYNTSMIIMNDALGDIEKDPEFGKRISRAVSEVTTAKWVAGEEGRPFWGVDVAAHGAGISVNAATVLETHHADSLSVVAFGRNQGTVLSPCVWPYGSEEDEKLRIVKALADQLGYTLRKKPERK